MFILIILLLHLSSLAYSYNKTAIIPSNVIKSPKLLHNYAIDSTNINTVKKTLTLIVEKYPNYNHINTIIDKLGTIYFLLEDFERSYHYYNLLASKNNHLKGKAIHFMAKILILKKDYKKAKTIINKDIAKLKQDEYFFKLIYLVGESMFYRHKYKQVISLFTHIKGKELLLKNREDSIMPSLLLRLGQSYFYQKDLINAKKYFSLLIKQFPSATEARFAQNWVSKLTKESSLVVRNTFFSPFIIQVGVFSNYQNALEIKNSIKELNISSIIISSKTDYKTLYKVIIPAQSKYIANLMIKNLSKEGIDAIIIKQ